MGLSTMDPGEGVFYGPKIDTKLKDSLGRLWQGPTVQVDFNLPERFDVNHIGEDGEKHRAIMIPERFSAAWRGSSDALLSSMLERCLFGLLPCRRKFFP